MPNFFTVKVYGLKFNAKGYTEALDKVIQIQIRQAAREWLRAVFKEVPVYSGQARASLLPLGRYLRVSIPIDPVDKATKRYPNAITTGQSQQTYEFRAEGAVYTFSFSTQVPHYLVNEFNTGLGSPPLIHPTPWNSLQAGKIAFQQYLRNNLKKKIPKISKYVTRTKIGE